MRKKILFIVVAIFAFFTTTSVFATKLTCDYGEYIVEIDTLYYKEGENLNNDGNCDEKPLCLYTKEGRILPFTIDEDEITMEFKKMKCPYSIYLKKSETIQNVRYKMYFRNSPDAERDATKYKLLSTRKENSKKVSCGNITDMPKKIPELTSMAMNIVHVAVPVILVIVGTLDLFKGITAQKEDEIKKGRQVFIKRLILAVLIFFIVVIVKLIISVVASSSNDNISSCIDCFISNNCN